MNKEMYDIVRQANESKAKIMSIIEAFGDELAEQQEYVSVSGIDAVHYYLIQKHNWIPSVVKSLNIDDLSFLLTEEMHGWILPEGFRD